MHVSVVGNPDNSVVITIRGHLDIDSAPVLATTLDQVLDQPAACVVVDLAGVDFCDSPGIGALALGSRRATANGGWLRLAGPSSALTGLLSTAPPGQGIPVFATVAEALAAR